MLKHTDYQTLDPKKIAATTSALSERINERFPDSGLYTVSQKLLTIGLRAEEQVVWINKPILSLRIGISLLITLILIGLGAALFSVGTPIQTMNLIEIIQAFESGINDIILITVAVFFLTTLERRFKRHRALQVINELRAIAHIIDMHQLTKDPVRQHWETVGTVLARKQLSAFLLTRYLDYCSEMLSLVGKISALYIQRFDDPVALAAVNDVENLATGLSRKIWQKLMILQHNIDTTH